MSRLKAGEARYDPALCRDTWKPGSLTSIFEKESLIINFPLPTGMEEASETPTMVVHLLLRDIRK